LEIDFTILILSLPEFGRLPCALECFFISAGKACVAWKNYWHEGGTWQKGGVLSPNKMALGKNWGQVSKLTSVACSFF
jgi:hypothetical protein